MARYRKGRPARKVLLTSERRPFAVPDVVLSERWLNEWEEPGWAKRMTHLPCKFSPEADTRLRKEISKRLDELENERWSLRHGAALASALRKPGKGQHAPLERLVKGLRTAAKAARELERLESPGTVYDPPHAAIGWWAFITFGLKLEAMVVKAEKKLAQTRASGKLVTVETPWPKFVRGIARCLKDAGLKPGVTGSVYDPTAKPTWFQEFMYTLNTTLLENIREPVSNKAAFYAGITKAMRGDRKPGKSRK